MTTLGVIATTMAEKPVTPTEISAKVWSASAAFISKSDSFTGRVQE
jgi:hypothetical protein